MDLWHHSYHAIVLVMEDNIGKVFYLVKIKGMVETGDVVLVILDHVTPVFHYWCQSLCTFLGSISLVA